MRAVGSSPQLKASQLPDTTDAPLVAATSSSSLSTFAFGSRSRAVLQSKLRAGLWWALLTLVLILGTVPLTLWLCQQPLHRLQQQQHLLETGGTASLQPDYYYQRLGMLLQHAEPLSAQEVSNALRAAALGLLYGEPVVLVSGPSSGSTEPSTLQQRSRRLVFELQQMLAEIPHANHPVRTCQLDPGFAGSRLDGERFLVAVNLHNNEGVLPHQILQLIQLMAMLPSGDIVLSIYESGSHDSSPEWLELLGHLLELMHASALIVVRGSERGASGSQRIQQLAKLRNLALKPLWDDEGVTFLSKQEQQGSFQADRVIFINDVFFCVNDVMRLAFQDADLACGMDFQQQFPGLLAFYDTWVARDAEGFKFNHGGMPYVREPFAEQRIWQGLPFPVSCCWNGMAVLSAAPFQNGTRFRADDPEGCPSSECSLICDDFIRAGHTKMVVDPGVQLAYDAKLAHALMVHPARQPSGKKFIPQSSWAEVLAKPIPAARFPTRFVNNCCQHFARFLLLCQQRNVLRAGDDSPTSWLSGTPLRPLVLPAWAHL